MSADVALVGEVLELSRQPIVLDPQQHYTVIGMRSFGKGIFHYPPTPASELSKLRYFRFPAGALALSNIKAWEGAIGVTSKNDTQSVASNRFLFYVPRNSQRVDVNYLRYYFLSPAGLSAIGAASPGSADRNRTLSIAAFGRIPIPLPPVSEQRRIAAALDDIERTARAFEERRVSSASIAASIVDSFVGDAWPRKRIGDASDRVMRPERVESEKEYSLLGVRWYGGGTFLRERRNGASIAAKTLYRVAEGDFIYNRLFGWKGAFGIIGPEHHGHVVSNEFPCYRGKHDVMLTEYLAAVCSAEGFMEAALSRSRGATATSRNRLREDEFESLTIPVPPLAVQRRVVLVSQDMQRYRSLRERQAELFSALRQSALNAAFSGKL